MFKILKIWFPHCAFRYETDLKTVFQANRSIIFNIFDETGTRRRRREAGQFESVLTSLKIKKSLFYFHNLVELVPQNIMDGSEAGFDRLCKRKSR